MRAAQEVTAAQRPKLPGGDAPVAGMVAGRLWELVLVVGGFGSKHAALAFESAWQKPHTSRHVSRAWAALGFGKCGSATSVRVRLEALCLLLEHGVWVREPLSVRVLCERVPAATSHVRGSRASRTCASARITYR